MRSRVAYADVLRVGATFTVVVLHTAAPVLYEFNSVDRAGWLIADIVDSCCRWAVPVFLMLSGMLLLNPQRSEPLGSFFWKRVNKVVLPFAIWSIIYSFWTIDGHNILYYITSDEGFPYSVTGFLRDFLRGEVHYHLWYFYPLIALYVMTPVIRFFVKGATARNLVGFLVLWLVAAASYSAVLQFSGLDISGPAYYGTFAVVAIGYFVLGHFLNKVDVGGKVRAIIYGTAAVGLLISILGTYFWTSRADGVLESYFFDYFTINVIVLSAAVFLACRQADWKKRLPDGSRASRFLADASAASLGIYLIHPIFLEALSYVKIDAIHVHPALAIPFVSVAAIAASFVAVWVLRRVPLIKRIVP